MGLIKGDNDNYYYYFKLRNGVEYAIKVTLIHINTSIMTMYREMTDEQREFYLANPTASVQEVVNCELTPPYVPPTPDVAEYAAQKCKDLKEACLGTITVSTIEYAMAADKLDNLTADCYYSLTDARTVINDFRTQSKTVMTLYDTYAGQMTAAATVEAIDTLYNEAIGAL
ncbi:MAG: hypothetical protein K6A41_04345 [Bacteroidales bacterium]|nr:hypothetical protein [Bacteroidales bacterium]